MPKKSPEKTPGKRSMNVSLRDLGPEKPAGGEALAEEKEERTAEEISAVEAEEGVGGPEEEERGGERRGRDRGRDRGDRGGGQRPERESSEVQKKKFEAEEKKRQEEKKSKQMIVKEKIVEELAKGNADTIFSVWEEAKKVGIEPSDLDLSGALADIFEEWMVKDELEKAKKMGDFLKRQKVVFNVNVIGANPRVLEHLAELISSAEVDKAKNILKYFKEAKIGFSAETFKTDPKIMTALAGLIAAGDFEKAKAIFKFFKEEKLEFERQSMAGHPRVIEGVAQLICAKDFEKAGNVLKFFEEEKIKFDWAPLGNDAAIQVKLKELILNGQRDEAKSIKEFLEGRKITLKFDQLKRELETHRNKLWEKGKEQAKEALKLEKAAEAAGIVLAPPPKGVRLEEVEKRVSELKEQIREAEAGKLIDPAKIKERFGQEAREGVFGDIMTRLLSNKELLTVNDLQEKKREKEVIDKMARVFEHEFGARFSRGRCEDIYFAAKSWMLQRAVQEEKPKFWGRLLQPKKWVGKLLKAGAYMTVGVGSTLLTGPLGILITGALRQIDLVGNRVLDEKMANRFRQTKGKEPVFMDELETNLANLVSAEVKRTLHPDKVTHGMNLEERTRYYFDRIVERPEIDGDKRLNQEEKVGIAQRLAVQYALDDETENRRLQTEEEQRPGFWRGFLRPFTAFDKQLAGKTPHERFQSGMAMTGLGLGLALAAREVPLMRRILAGWGGWMMGGALYEMRKREFKDPVLDTERRLKNAATILGELKAAATAGNFPQRDKLEGDLRTALSETKAALIRMPAGRGAGVRYENFQQEFQKLQMELVLVEFQKEQENRWWDQIKRKLTEEELVRMRDEKLLTSQALAGATAEFDVSREEMVTGERGRLFLKRLASRLVGMTAGIALSEEVTKIAQEHGEEIKKWFGDLKDKIFGKEAAPAGRVVRAGAAGGAAGGVTVAVLEGRAKGGAAPLEMAPGQKTPEQLLENFKKTHGILDNPKFNVRAEGGRVMVDVEIGKGKGFRYLDNALHRLMMQEYNLGSKTSFNALDAGRVENGLANLRELLFGKKLVGGFKPGDLAEFITYNQKTGALRISDYGKFSNYADKLLDFADKVVKTDSGVLAYADNRQNDFQPELDQKTHSPRSVVVDDFRHDPLVHRAEQKVFFEQYSENIGLAAKAVVAIDESSGYVITADGYRIDFDHNEATMITPPAGVKDVSMDLSGSGVSLAHSGGDKELQGFIASYQKPGPGGVEIAAGMKGLIGSDQLIHLGKASFRQDWIKEIQNMTTERFIKKYGTIADSLWTIPYGEKAERLNDLADALRDIKANTRAPVGQNLIDKNNIAKLTRTMK